jgi:transcriptional regulator with XRE-family HTH domain
MVSAVQPSAFGDLLRQHRLDAGLTQEELAERANLSARAVSDLERGVRRTPRNETIALLAQGLGLSPAQRTTFAEEACGRPPGASGSMTLARAPDGC